VVVTSVSCGESHAALITSNGKVLTWGNGEHGALGHGTKTATPAPKLVKALASLICVSVSCGPYHTGFVAGDEEEISYVRVPPSASSPSRFSQMSAMDGEGGGGEGANEFLTCASLYTCGQGKAGQLGMGLSLPGSRSPRVVPWFAENGFKVAKVSCGMHHTLVIGVPVHAMRMFSTAVFSCGWGEHGRLGLGNEEGALEPTQVGFPEPFHAIDISAGEQHSLASSGKVGGCYAWGSNGFGQCGTGSPSQMEHCLYPTKVPVPEGSTVAS
jgi:alpha-tubulin suppressor-like RCC1 family protein